MQEDEETRGEKLKALRRGVAEGWLEGRGKEVALNVVDEVVFEAGGGSAPPSEQGKSTGTGNALRPRPGCRGRPPETLLGELLRGPGPLGKAPSTMANVPKEAARLTSASAVAKEGQRRLQEC